MMETSECHELPAAKSAQHGCEGPPPQLRASPIAALVRQGAQTASLRQGSKRASTMVQRMINSLQWRQAHSKDEFYPLALESGAELRLRQLQAGEMTGLGTGATVWPAAHVLAKYLERRYGEDGMKGLRVVDLGSGTGVAGIAAAALGAAESFLTDQEQLLFLMRENAERCARDRDICADAIRVLVYDWGMSDEGLSPPVDVILISDCVLPKLYSIEPLVDAIDKLSGPETVTIMSYEHRYYPAFDPRRRFDEVAISRGLAKVTIPQVQQHPIFFADDIEIWEVRRIQKITSLSNDDKQGNSFIKAIDETRTAKDTTDWTSLVDVVVVSPSPSDQGVTVVKLQGEQHKLSQSLSGAIGCYLWPSSVIMARHLLTAAFESPTVTSTTSSIGDGGEFSRPCPSYPRRANMLEFGSGVGLVAMAAALMGWNVVATDRTDVLPLLKINIDRCLSSTTRAHGVVGVMEYEWGGDAQALLMRNATSPGSHETIVGSAHEIKGYDFVICSDCVYAKSSVKPLLASLRQVCCENTVVLVTNELRSAFDEFLQAAREQFAVEDLPLLEEDMVVDPTSNQRPTPVALKRLRRLQSTLS